MRVFVRRQSSGQIDGQIVVEYVLLLVVAVSIASIIVFKVASRNPDNPGFIVAKWQEILQFIGDDMADDVQSQSQ